jgi:hypothetical protein
LAEGVGSGLHPGKQIRAMVMEEYNTTSFTTRVTWIEFDRTAPSGDILFLKFRLYLPVTKGIFDGLFALPPSEDCNPS